MSEAELHVIRARLLGGIRNKAQRGELRRSLPIGLVWGEADGETRFDPDEAVIHAVQTVFEKFAETGSVRQVWIWFRSQKLLFPSRPHMRAPLRWIPPTYHALHAVLKVGSSKWRYMTLDALEFIRRFLQHLLPNGFMKIRHYGFLSPNFAVPLQKIRESICALYELLRSRPVKVRAPRKPRPLRCPRCQAPMQWRCFIPPGHFVT